MHPTTTLLIPSGRMCDTMYETFRETGVFVGNDAKYCLYEHPDAGKCIPSSMKIPCTPRIHDLVTRV